MPKDKEQTKQRLLDAVGSIIMKHGFQGIGINAIAREAGVDKVLIYRYFSDLDGLLLEFAAQNDYFSNLPDVLGQPRALCTKTDALVMAKQILSGQLRQFLESKELQEILLWELTQKNQVTDAIAAARETQGQAVLAELKSCFQAEHIDLDAIANLLIGGIAYLVLRSRTVEMFNGINLHTGEGWQRIENALHMVLDLLVERQT